MAQALLVLPYLLQVPWLLHSSKSLLTCQSTIYAPDSGSSTRNVSLSTASSPNGSARIDTPKSDVSQSICGDQAASIRGHSAEQDATDNLDDLFDIDSGMDSDSMNELAFDPSDPDDEDPLTLQEMYEDLEDILGPGNEEELWKIRMFQLIISI